MRIAVLGATGGTGRHVIAAGLARDHEMMAVVRRPGSFEPTAGLHEAVWPDLADQATLTAALTGQDVVISAIGGADKGPTSVCADAVRTAVAAMGPAGVSRLIVVSAHGVLETHDRSLYVMAAWAGVAEKMKDKEAMEPLLTSSPGLDWTIVRPPRLTSTSKTGRHRTGVDLPIRLWHVVGRADLAAFLIEEAENPRFIGAYPRIHR